MDLGNLLGDMDDRLDYSGRHEKIADCSTQLIYDEHSFLDIRKPVIFVHPLWNQLSVNNDLTDSINKMDVGPVVWITEEALDQLNYRFVRGMEPVCAHWYDNRNPKITTISIAWVEDNRSDNPKGGVRMELGGYRDFVWMIDSSNPENYDRLNNLWKAEWRD